MASWGKAQGLEGSVGGRRGRHGDDDRIISQIVSVGPLTMAASKIVKDAQLNI
jgi:hypothetical protein